ncbi:hypothetical protein JNJ66_07240 [Candidatus Saccharibacteria bacterium]|nr:hypothetical protein [Candidatus Saccharibacteria bacterium]
MSRNQDKDKQLLLTQLAKTPIVEAACKHVGLPRSTYYRWRKEDESFADACDETIELSIGRINDLAESQLINAIKDQNMSAITFWLKHHHHRYRNRLEVDARIQAVQQELTPDQVELVGKALQLAGISQLPEEKDDAE